MPAGQFSVSLQENLLTLLCFDDEAALIIRNAVEAMQWGNSIYRDIVTRVYDYIDSYSKAPGEHTPDLLEDRLKADNEQTELYIDTLNGIHELKDSPGFNRKYALDSLEHFVRVSSLKSTIIQAGEELQSGELDEHGLERIEVIMQQGLQHRLTTFAPGIRLREAVTAAFEHKIRSNVLDLGIEALDRYEIGCGDGEIMLYEAGPKTGKTWWLIHNSKRCLIHKEPVVYITLELSDKQIGMRHAQALFSMTRHKTEQVHVTRFGKDDSGLIVRFERDALSGRLSFDDPKDQAIVERRMNAMHGLSDLIIKQFPANHLTVNGLRSYLDLLERALKFRPRKVILDYVKYMKHDVNEYRISRGQILNDLRGLCVERNIGIITAVESNRLGLKARQLDASHMGEDISGAYTADTVLTYTQTVQERQLGLARLLVDSTRVAERDKYLVLLTQAYAIGQYCIDSTMMSDRYAVMLESATVNQSTEEEA